MMVILEGKFIAWIFDIQTKTVLILDIKHLIDYFLAAMTIKEKYFLRLRSFFRSELEIRKFSRTN